MAATSVRGESCVQTRDRVLGHQSGGRAHTEQPTENCTRRSEAARRPRRKESLLPKRLSCYCINKGFPGTGSFLGSGCTDLPTRQESLVGRRVTHGNGPQRFQKFNLKFPTALLQSACNKCRLAPGHGDSGAGEASCGAPGASSNSRTQPTGRCLVEGAEATHAPALGPSPHRRVCVSAASPWFRRRAPYEPGGWQGDQRARACGFPRQARVNLVRKDAGPAEGDDRWLPVGSRAAPAQRRAPEGGWHMHTPARPLLRPDSRGRF